MIRVSPRILFAYILVTIIPFLTAMELSDTHMKRAINNEEMAGELITEGSKEDIKLQPFIAPINHNTLTSAKTMNIVHTLMGNFCHGDKDKISQIRAPLVTRAYP